MAPAGVIRRVLSEAPAARHHHVSQLYVHSTAPQSLLCLGGYGHCGLHCPVLDLAGLLAHGAGAAAAGDEAVVLRLGDACRGWRKRAKLGVPQTFFWHTGCLPVDKGCAPLAAGMCKGVGGHPA